MEFPKDYLGDGVYAGYDGFSIELRANDFESPTDSIVLEPDVLEALNRFSERCASWKTMELKKQQPTAAVARKNKSDLKSGKSRKTILNKTRQKKWLCPNCQVWVSGDHCVVCGYYKGG